MDYKLDIVLLLTIGFAFASLLGVIAVRLKLPAILGFLVAGYLIGPYSPGFVVDLHQSEQLAEIGVILMLFGVGLHFHLQDLINVKKVAIPGAIGQTAIATILGTLFVCSEGLPVTHGVIVGLAISVASTVVLVRILSDNHLLETQEGHIAVGWLIVEDILTIIMLILLPIFAAISTSATLTYSSLVLSITFSLAKFFLLAFLVLKWGDKVVGYLLTIVARLKSQELFTLSVLALTFIIATVSAVIFDTSIALGAFLAGIVIGQTDVRHQALANSLPLKDVFAVIFFLSIGMLFDPKAIYNHFSLFIGILGIILIVKPISAYFLVRILRYPRKVSATVAVSLAQIGEFSFILAEQATKLKLLPDMGYDILVASAFVSISLNPLFFRLMRWMQTTRPIRALYSADIGEKFSHLFQSRVKVQPEAIVVGFGPIGSAVTEFLEEQDVEVVVVEHNIDTLSKVKDEGRKIIYGDATVANILQVTEINKASLLIITIPDLSSTISIINSARTLNSNLKIIVRVSYSSDIEKMKNLDVETISVEDEVQEAFIEKVKQMLQT